MPSVETNSPVNVEINVTTEAPTIDVQIDGYLRSEMFVVDIACRLTRPTDIYDPPTARWEMSATANEIADAVAHGKTITGHRITDSEGALLNGYTECLFGGISNYPPVSATFKEIKTTGITRYTVSGDSKLATVNTVPFSTEGGTLLVTFSHNGERWVADKTFAEVTAAIADGAYVYATDTAAFYTLTECDPRPNDGAVTFVAAGDPILGITLWHDEDVDTFGASFATQTWVQSQGYLTQHQSLAAYQTKSITDTGGYYTTDTVEGALQEIGAELANIAGKADKTPRIAMTGADTAPTLDPNKLYVFPEMASLSPTFTAPSDNTTVNEYHFIFKSGATATTTTFPAIPGLDDFAAEANMAYEVSILEGRALVTSWEVSA